LKNLPAKTEIFHAKIKSFLGLCLIWWSGGQSGRLLYQCFVVQILQNLLNFHASITKTSVNTRKFEAENIESTTGTGRLHSALILDSLLDENERKKTLAAQKLFQSLDR
jgi:hypothetical protein